MLFNKFAQLLPGNDRETKKRLENQLGGGDQSAAVQARQSAAHDADRAAMMTRQAATDGGMTGGAAARIAADQRVSAGAQSDQRFATQRAGEVQQAQGQLDQMAAQKNEAIRGLISGAPDVLAQVAGFGGRVMQAGSTEKPISGISTSQDPGGGLFGKIKGAMGIEGQPLGGLVGGAAQGLATMYGGPVGGALTGQVLGGGGGMLGGSGGPGGPTETLPPRQGPIGGPAVIGDIAAPARVAPDGSNRITPLRTSVPEDQYQMQMPRQGLPESRVPMLTPPQGGVRGMPLSAEILPQPPQVQLGPLSRFGVGEPLGLDETGGDGRMSGDYMTTPEIGPPQQAQPSMPVVDQTTAQDSGQALSYDSLGGPSPVQVAQQFQDRLAQVQGSAPVAPAALAAQQPVAHDANLEQARRALPPGTSEEEIRKFAQGMAPSSMMDRIQRQLRGPR